MSNRLEVLHIASFNGNIGDNANHNGFRYLFEKNFERDIRYNELEIRKFYFSWQKRNFDKKFAERANENDLVIFGGGNFFDLTWPQSSTGCTIDIPKMILERINTPILFNAIGLGYGISRSYNEEAISNFEDLLQYFSNNPDDYFVSLRNDGSMDNMRELFGSKFDEHVLEVPDNGFFVQTEDSYHPELIGGYNSIGVNIVCDGEENRFNKDISIDDFKDKFSQILTQVLQEYPNYQIIFFPHIYSDVNIIYNVIERIPDDIRRIRLKIAPYLSGQGSEKYIMNLYENCELLLGMRFHSNVGAIAKNVPSISMATNHYRVPSLYDKLGIDDRVLKVNVKGFDRELKKHILDTLKGDKAENIQQTYDEINQNLKKQGNNYLQKVRAWFLSEV